MATSATETGLANQALLAKIDKLRELNVGAIIPLPQLVVIGDQSSGKSSVLESLTGFSFPRSAGLCTRYVTQITCCRDPQRGVVISIIPRPDADEALKERLLKFQRRTTEMDNAVLSKIFHQANVAMGIRMKTSNQANGMGAFSQDILKIEISGPEQDHLTVIDVPGIFRVPTPGLTTETDIKLVENMVKSYMSNRRTIILAVMPCNVDIATQEILKLAEAADPDGVRTMGVLTKPDLAMETATKDAIVQLVLGKRSILRLGYYIVKNRSADDSSSTLGDRAAAEKAFFMASPWSSLADRCGTAALKARLRHLLMHLSKQEFPHVKIEIEQRLNRCRADLKAMGPSRADQGAQRQYLGKIASNFQNITQAALNGYYAADKAFKTHPDLKLITKIIKLNEVFSNVFWLKGHRKSFGPAGDDQEESPFQGDIDSLPFKVPLADYAELEDIIITDEYECPRSSGKAILEDIKHVFESSRGPDLGTFSGTILATVFEEQTEKWEPLVLSHTSNAITLVHDFICKLLYVLCPEKQVKEQLWEILLVDELCERYRRAMNHARFLLLIERGGKPATFNHYFNANLQKRRGERLTAPLKAMAVKRRRPHDDDEDEGHDEKGNNKQSMPTKFRKSFPNKDIGTKQSHGQKNPAPPPPNDESESEDEDDEDDSEDESDEDHRDNEGSVNKNSEDNSKDEKYIPISKIGKLFTDKSNAQQTCEDILDTLASYYKVSRKRFVDVVCQQVVGHFLLEGDESPLKVFGSEVIMGLDAAQLDAIAGEDAVSKDRRQVLSREIESLEAALKVLRL